MSYLPKLQDLEHRTCWTKGDQEGSASEWPASGRDRTLRLWLMLGFSNSWGAKWGREEPILPRLQEKGVRSTDQQPGALTDKATFISRNSIAGEGKGKHEVVSYRVGVQLQLRPLVSPGGGRVWKPLEAENRIRTS